MVSAIHIVLILIYTVLTILVDIVFDDTSKKQIELNAALIFFGGLLDIIVSYMMFFIFDEEREMMTNLVKD